MKIKIFLVTILLVLIFGISFLGFSFAYAQGMTESQRQAAIAQLEQEISQLQAEINQMVKNCKPNWQCGKWSLCVGGQQTKICTDANGCGTATNEPSLNQTCTQTSGVRIQVNGSDGPLNLFLTQGGGAYSTGTQINLSQSINLQWQSINVGSCIISDSINPSAFSGYVPASGSQSVTLSGNISNNSSGSNKVSDTFRISCVPINGSGTVTDNVTVNLFYAVNSNCYPSWECTNWTNCNGGQQTRTCTDWNGCGSSSGEPLLQQFCSPT